MAEDTPPLVSIYPSKAEAKSRTLSITETVGSMGLTGRAKAMSNIAAVAVVMAMFSMGSTAGFLFLRSLVAQSREDLQAQQQQFHETLKETQVESRKSADKAHTDFQIQMKEDREERKDQWQVLRELLATLKKDRGGS
jgi:hypothetical protein